LIVARAKIENGRFELLFSNFDVIQVYQRFGGKSTSIYDFTSIFFRAVRDPLLTRLTYELDGQSYIQFNLELTPELMQSSMVETIRLSRDSHEILLFLEAFFLKMHPYRHEDLQYLGFNKRSTVTYDIKRLVETVRTLSEEWGFNPKLIIEEYLQINPKKPAFTPAALMPRTVTHRVYSEVTKFVSPPKIAPCEISRVIPNVSYRHTPPPLPLHVKLNEEDTLYKKSLRMDEYRVFQEEEQQEVLQEFLKDIFEGVDLFNLNIPDELYT
jgi:hypothetical protein